MRIIEINGNKFSNMKGFYREIESKMTFGLNWKIGRNLNAFNDVLYGGFGVHDVDEKYILK
ncbi:barstar family protein [Winogradskyella rapida]|uniref:Barstar family protein n=2 Tax=Pseudomonadati TaxID=3379134 RepID=A0ABW3KPM5_9FLAO